MILPSFSAPEDMELGPDGRIYVLEYGQGWFQENPDAALARIDYLPGNRPPKLGPIVIDKTSGGLPFTLNASVKASDPENDQLTYVWTIGKEKKETTEPHLDYTIAKAGDYPVSVEVTDKDKAAAQSDEVTVYAGNSAPEISLAVQGNRSFYFPGKPVSYQVKVNDEGDEVDMDNLYVSKEYISGRDMAAASQGHQEVSGAMIGKNLMMNADCKSCHQIAEKSIGPSFTQVSEHYKKDAGAANHLTNKIIKGGSGVWGETVMPAHPDMPQDDVEQIVQWVLSLANAKQMAKSLPASGKVMPTGKEENSVLRLMATYTDKGAAGVRPLTASDVIYLRNNSQDVRAIRDVEGLVPQDSAGSRYLVLPSTTGWIRGQNLDMSGISSIQLSGVGPGASGSYHVEIRAGKPDGDKIGEGMINFGGSDRKIDAKIPVQSAGNGEMQDIYLVFKSEKGGKAMLKTITFMPGSTASL